PQRRPRYFFLSRRGAGGAQLTRAFRAGCPSRARPEAHDRLPEGARPVLVRARRSTWSARPRRARPSVGRIHHSGGESSFPAARSGSEHYRAPRIVGAAVREGRGCSNARRRTLDRAMPELPDVTVYIERLRALIGGQRLDQVRLASPFVVRSVDPPIR